MTVREFNGWDTHESWAVALHIDNDYPVYTLVQEFIKRATSLDEFMDMLEQHFLQSAPILNPPFDELLNIAFSLVVWAEVARHMAAESHLAGQKSTLIVQLPSEAEDIARKTKVAEKFFIHHPHGQRLLRAIKARPRPPERIKQGWIADQLQECLRYEIFPKVPFMLQDLLGGTVFDIDYYTLAERVLHPRLRGADRGL